MKVNATIYVERNGEELEVSVTGNYKPGRAGSFYKGYGDPGDPPEPGEIEDVEAEVDGKPIELTQEEYDKACEKLLDSEE